MNPVQERLAELTGKGWTMAAIAREVGTSYNTIQKWKAGERYPTPEKPILQALDGLCQRKRIPKKRQAPA